MRLSRCWRDGAKEKRDGQTERKRDGNTEFTLRGKRSGQAEKREEQRGHREKKERRKEKAYAEGTEDAEFTEKRKTEVGCRDSSTPRPDTPKGGAEEKIGPLRSE